MYVSPRKLRSERMRCLLINDTMEFTLPIYGNQTATKKVLLGMNNYRNWHYQLSNKLKAQFHELVHMQIKEGKKFKQISVIYKLYLKREDTDGGNVRAVIEKFFLDALVKGGVIPDDSLHYVVSDTSIYHIDKKNPRVEIIIQGERDELK